MFDEIGPPLGHEKIGIQDVWQLGGLHFSGDFICIHQIIDWLRVAELNVVVCLDLLIYLLLRVTLAQELDVIQKMLQDQFNIIHPLLRQRHLYLKRTVALLMIGCMST